MTHTHQYNKTALYPIGIAVKVRSSQESLSAKETDRIAHFQRCEIEGNCQCQSILKNSLLRSSANVDTLAHYTQAPSLWGETDGQAVWFNVSRSFASYILRQKPWDISENHLHPQRWRWCYLVCSVMYCSFHYCHAIPKATYRRCIFTVPIAHIVT